MAGVGMQAATATFDTITSQSFALVADANQTIAKVTTRSKIALKHFGIIRGLASLASSLASLLDNMHASELAFKLESASPDDRQKLAENIRRVHAKMADVLDLIKSVEGNLGYWRTPYLSQTGKLAILNAQLNSLMAAIGSEEAPVLLTVNEQRQVLKDLTNSSAPNDALRRAFSRR